MAMTAWSAKVLSRAICFDRLNEEGLRETDWNLALLLWGGSSEDGSEDYFAFIPFYADIPDFLTYDRFQIHLFPLHVGLEKGDNTSHIFLWPLIGWGGNGAKLATEVDSRGTKCLICET